jgi:hypothetical protein
MKIGKTFLLASALTLVSLPSTATAQDHAEPEIVVPTNIEGEKPTKSTAEAVRESLNQSLEMLRKIYRVDQRPAIDATRMPEAERIAAAVISATSVRDMFNNTYGGAVDYFGSYMTRMDASQLVAAFGLPIEQADDVSDEQLLQISQIIDPQQQERVAQIRAIAQPYIDETLAVVVPAWQAGSAKAAARQFDASELAAIRTFFESEAGRKMAAHLMAWLTDPEITLGVVAALPQLVERLEPKTKMLPDQMKALAPLRSAQDLTDAELRKIAKILKADYKAIKAHRKAQQAELAAALAEAEEDAANPLNQPITEIEAYDRDQWTADHVAKVAALEQAVATAQQALNDAETAAIADANARLTEKDSPNSGSAASDTAH